MGSSDKKPPPIQNQWPLPMVEKLGEAFEENVLGSVD